MTRANLQTKGSFGVLGVAIVLAVAVLLLLPGRALAASSGAVAPAPAEPIASAQTLADALNVDAPAGASYAEVSDDGGVVTLLTSLTVDGSEALEITVPAGERLELDLNGNDLSLENGATSAAGQLVASGDGTLAITGDGELASETADGSIPSVQIQAGTLELSVPVAIETPVSASAALRIAGGTLELAATGSVTGSTVDYAAIVGVASGAFDLEGTITCTGDEKAAAFIMSGGEATLAGGTIYAPGTDVGFGVVVMGDGACAICGTEVEGSVQAMADGSITISEGHVEGQLDAFDGTIAVTVDEAAGHGASFGRPVSPELLVGVGGVEFEFNPTQPSAYFRYFATVEDARADAELYPTVNWASVSEDAYVCWYGFLDNGEDATDYYQTFYRCLGIDNSTAFFGPAMMCFTITRPGVGFTFTFRDATGRVVYQEDAVVTPDSTICAPFFNASLPGELEYADAAVDVGEYTLELTSLENPSEVYSTSQLGISKVTLNGAGGTYPADYATVKYLMQSGWAMKELPVRPGFELAGWITEPTAGMVTWDAAEDSWSYATPRTGGDFTFTAQWSPEAEVVEVSRLWMPASGAHLLTDDANEIRVLTSDYGWRDEGVVFTAYGAPIAGAVPVTRLLNPNNGDHLYTTSASEVRGLEAVGWRSEGVKFYGADETDHPVYRLWNSLQTESGGLGSHLWTVDRNEYDTLPQLPPVSAWKQEGPAWYAVGLPD